MKYFMIKYRLEQGTAAEWHQDIAHFIAALDGDSDLQGKIAYRCMKVRDGNEYLHIAAAADGTAIKTLQQRDFFASYTEKTNHVSGGGVVVVPLELVAQTRYRA